MRRAEPAIPYKETGWKRKSAPGLLCGSKDSRWYPTHLYCMRSKQIDDAPRERLWQLPDSRVTSEADYLRRRDFLRVFGIGLAATALLPAGFPAAAAELNDSLNPAFKLDGIKLTPEELVTSYNNFYEWGIAKDEPKNLANRGWNTAPWKLEIGGLCANPTKVDVAELVDLSVESSGGITGIDVSKRGRW